MTVPSVHETSLVTGVMRIMRVMSVTVVMGVMLHGQTRARSALIHGISADD
jgi:hypothetical protein